MTSPIPVSTGSKSQAAYDFLYARIADGRFGPGYRLVLGQIADELGCSVVPVREAIRRLEAEGAVTYIHNVGATVTALDREVYRDTMETLALVEGYATALGAPLLALAELDEARALNREMREMAEGRGAALDATRFTELNRRLHEVLFRHCPNSHIADLVQRGWHRLATMRESSFGLVPGRTRASVDEHDALIELIADSAAPEVVEHAAREHRIATMRAVLETTARP